MDEYTTIGAVLSAIVAIFGAVARVRSFEKSIIAEVDKRIDEAFRKINASLAQKSDVVAAARIEAAVGNLTQDLTDFIRRQEDHIKTLYDQDHELEQKVTDVRIELANKADRE
jgi:gas vesicle protein